MRLYRYTYLVKRAYVYIHVEYDLKSKIENNLKTQSNYKIAIAQLFLLYTRLLHEKIFIQENLKQIHFSRCLETKSKVKYLIISCPSLCIII